MILEGDDTGWCSMILDDDVTMIPHDAKDDDALGCYVTPGWQDDSTMLDLIVQGLIGC